MLARASKAAMHCILASTIRMPFLRRNQWVGMVKNSSLRRFPRKQISNPTKAAAQPRSWLVDEISILAKHQNGTEVLGDDHSDRRTMDLRLMIGGLQQRWH